MEESRQDTLARVEAFDFRGMGTHIRFGTASDRYAGWIGQIYPEEYRTRLKARSKKLGGKSYREEVLPVDSVYHYFQHFSVLELDFTFYRPLLDQDGTASSNLFALREYAEQAPDDALFYLKAPQTYFARQFRRGKGEYEVNPQYLDAGAYREQFLKPARDILGDRLHGIQFEQEYQRVSEAPSDRENIAELDGFFAGIGDGPQAHIEMRTPSLLTPAYFDWLETRGIGHVFSHWTWLPPLQKQWDLSGGRFTAANGTAVVRLLTPLKMRYEDAWAKTYPFDRVTPELADSPGTRHMIDDVVMLAHHAEDRELTIDVLANNRAYGNAPALSQAIAQRLVDDERV